MNFEAKNRVAPHDYDCVSDTGTKMKTPWPINVWKIGIPRNFLRDRPSSRRAMLTRFGVPNTRCFFWQFCVSHCQLGHTVIDVILLHSGRITEQIGRHRR